MLASRQEMQDLGKIQYNTSGVADTMVATQGEDAFYGSLAVKWEKWLSERHLSMPDLDIIWKNGVTGKDGIEGAWDMLCSGEVGAGEALVYRVQRT